MGEACHWKGEESPFGVKLDVCVFGEEGGEGGKGSLKPVLLTSLRSLAACYRSPPTRRPPKASVFDQGYSHLTWGFCWFQYKATTMRPSFTSVAGEPGCAAMSWVTKGSAPLSSSPPRSSRMSSPPRGRENTTASRLPSGLIPWSR